MVRTYFTHDNGGRPFKVIVDGLDVKVFKQTSDASYSDKPAKTFKPVKVFIGKSPLNAMTKFSAGHGKKFDGNSILLQMSDNEYVYIGEQIIRFKTDSVINKYVSPVGNSDVPYPYAIDKDKKVYLMIESIVLSDVPKKTDDPYDYFYKNSKNVSNEHANSGPKVSNEPANSGPKVSKKPLSGRKVIVKRPI